MRNLSITALTAGLLVCSVSVWAQSPCAITGDSTVSSADIQAAINGSIGVSACPSTVNIVGPGVCNAIVVQRVINASMGQACLTSTGLHVVSLTWAENLSSGVTGYQISRGASSSGPFTALASVAGAATTSYLDTTVVSGATYYYVVATVAGSSTSANSSPVAATVPTP